MKFLFLAGKLATRDGSGFHTTSGKSFTNLFQKLKWCQDYRHLDCTDTTKIRASSNGCHGFTDLVHTLRMGYMLNLKWPPL